MKATHEEGVAAAVQAMRELNNKVDKPKVEKRGDEVSITLSGLEDKQVAEAAIAAYVRARGIDL